MNLKPCSHCREWKPLDAFYHSRKRCDSRHNNCKICERLRDKRRRELGSLQKAINGWRKRNPQAVAAHNIVRNAIRRGDLQRLPCLVCGNQRSHAHHEDYSKPLDVLWFCQAHHVEHHRLERLYGKGQTLFDFFMEGWQ